MPEFSKQSLKNLSECDYRLQQLFMSVGHIFDCSIVCGRRSRAEQQDRFDLGKSLAKPGESLHNVQAPGYSLAVDVLPYPHDEVDPRRFYYFAGIVKGIGIELGIGVRWGGDWYDELFTKKISARTRHTFNDPAHWEMVD